MVVVMELPVTTLVNMMLGTGDLNHSFEPYSKEHKFIHKIVYVSDFDCHKKFEMINI